MKRKLDFFWNNPEKKFAGSKYRGVDVYKNVKGRISFKARISPTPGFRGKSKGFNTEREAAMQVDKWLIERGVPPVNILKRI